MTEKLTKPILLDEGLATKLFDCLHEKILQFIQLNYSSPTHHFLFIKEMQGAANPYDVKDIYPTGKCGKQTVKPSQIVKVFSKDASLKTAEQMLHHIELNILQLARPPKHQYDESSTEAILAVLREIKLGADDKALTKESVLKKLTTNEYHDGWPETTYHQFYDEGGYVKKFTPCIPHINDDLDYFRGLINSL